MIDVTDAPCLIVGCWCTGSRETTLCRPVTPADYNYMLGTIYNISEYYTRYIISGYEDPGPADASSVGAATRGQAGRRVGPLLPTAPDATDAQSAPAASCSPGRPGAVWDHYCRQHLLPLTPSRRRLPAVARDHKHSAVSARHACRSPFNTHAYTLCMYSTTEKHFLEFWNGPW